MFKTFLEAVLMSSSDPTKISLTIRGLLVTLVPVILIVAQHFGLGLLAESDVLVIIESLTKIIASILTLIGLFMTTWGMIRKLIAYEDLDDDLELQYTK